ncbi:lysophospholipid acyltransferase family protein [Candidatus Sororendozoicomonas aggregata]|uniref:lysophospholipid acyltransferase family protein n=1 Tax=Candidatus Sororendozoicomonas aggregata TaxID=3073239 RepID=UPI002ED63C23
MSFVVSTIRTALFYGLLSLWTIFFPTLCFLVIGFFPYKKRHKLLAKNWSLVSIYLCRVICGVRWEVHGKENIPDKGCVIISNHQSTWETFFLQTLLTPQTQVLKKELLSIPFFGWALRSIKPIAIDRKDPLGALQRIKRQGLSSLKKGVSVLIFPEGTRSHPGKVGKFSRGGAGLACSAGVDILPIAHNAGHHWPKDRWTKTPGTIHVHIGPVITTEDKGPAAANNQARDWVENTLAKYY